MKIEFSLEQLKLMDQAVQQMPYYLAAPLINHINEEIQKQDKKEEAKPSARESD